MVKKKEGQRLSIYLTSEALKIYDSLPRHERSKWVSEAIIEKFERDNKRKLTTKSTLEELELRIIKLEEIASKLK